MNYRDIEVLLFDAKAHKPVSLELLYFELFPIVSFYARTIILNSYSYDDLLQEGYLCLLKAVEKYTLNSSSFVGYFKITIRNHFLDFARKEKAYHFTELNDNILSDDEFLLDKVIFSLDLPFLLDNLSTREKNIINLHYISCFSLMDISVLLKIPYKSVSRSKLNALKKLRNNIKY